jgi:hypothetical protein
MKRPLAGNNPVLIGKQKGKNKTGAGISACAFLQMDEIVAESSVLRSESGHSLVFRSTGRSKNPNQVPPVASCCGGR